MHTPEEGSFEFVHEPSLPNLDLRMTSDETGELYSDKGAEDLLTGPMAEINRARLEAMGVLASVEQHGFKPRAYRTVGNHWVVDQRVMGQGAWPIQATRRVMRELDQGATTAHVRVGDVWGDSLEVGDRVAGLEKKGYVVAAQIEGNRHGVYVGEGVTDGGTLKGAHLEGVEPMAVRVARVLEPVMSEQPEEPDLTKNGLRRIPVHGMGLARFADGKWAKSQVLPSGAVGMDIFNNTAFQYAQEAFEGMICVFDGTDFNVYDMEANEERFAHSCEAMGMPALPKGQFVETIQAVLKANERYVKGMKPGDKFYVRPCAIGTKGGAGANAAAEYLFSVEVTPFALYLADPSQGVAMEGRLDIHRPPTGTDKVGPNYAPGFREKAAVKQRVPSNGKDHYADYISFDEDGEVEEVSAAAFFGLDRSEEAGDGKVTYRMRTPVTKRDGLDGAKHILPSTVRRLIIDLMQEITQDPELMAEMRASMATILKGKNIDVEIPEFDLAVDIANIHHSELPKMVGAFATGTAAGVTRIGLLDVKNGPDDTRPAVCDYEQDKVAIALIRYCYDLVMRAREGAFTGKLAKFNDKVTRIAVDPSLLPSEEAAQ